MDLLDFICQTNRLNIAMASVVSLGLLWTVIAHYNNRSRNFRSSRNKRERKQF